MAQEYALLDTYPLGEGVNYLHPERGSDLVHEDSPALHVFTDFSSRTPETVYPEVKSYAAIEQMKTANVKSLLVVDELDDKVIGLVSSRILQSAQAGVAAQENGVDPKDLTVAMMMVKCNSLHTLNFKDIGNARVGHIIRLIKDLGVFHLLVIDRDEENDCNMVRGIFSASRISRQIGEDITGDQHAASLAEINHRLD